MSDETTNPKPPHYEFHPLANLFPLIEGEEFDRLCEDIKANGLRQNIMLFEGKILDGRNRYRACHAVGETPRTIEYLGNDPFGYVAALNLLRRHLSSSQRAMIAAEMANMKLGANQHAAGRSVPELGGSANLPTLPSSDDVAQEPQPSNLDQQAGATSLDDWEVGWDIPSSSRSTNSPSCSTAGSEAAAPQISQAKAAEIMGTSTRSVTAAAAIKDHGVPELADAVRSGQMSINAGSNIAKLPEQEQREAIAERAEKPAGARKKSQSEDGAFFDPTQSQTPFGIMLRAWGKASSFQRETFLREAVPSVADVLSGMKRASGAEVSDNGGGDA